MEQIKMRMKPLWLACVVASVSGVMLVGCYESSTTESTAAVSEAKKASLTISAVFPQGGAQGQVGTALIDANTQAITVSVCDEFEYNCRTETLTPSNPSVSIAGLSPGKGYLSIYTTDSNDNYLDSLSANITLVEGSNTFTGTLIRGTWTLASAIILNKTMPGSTETLNSFSIRPGTSQPAAGQVNYAFNPTNPYGSTEHMANWNGSNLYDVTAGTNTLPTATTYLDYGNQFVGPSTNKNYLNGMEIPLTPDSNYPISSDIGSNRFAMMVGDTTRTDTFSDTSVTDLFTSKVTGATSIAGNLVEVLEKSGTSTQTCYNGYDATAPVMTCPSLAAAAKTAKAGKRSGAALLKAMATRSMATGKSAANAQNCYIDLVVTGSDSWSSSYYDANNIWKPMFVVENYTQTVDACGHPFTATGGQLQPVNSQITVQRSK